MNQLPQENLKILIVDDELLARTKLERMLLELNPAFILRQAKNGVEAIQLIEDFKPRVVFLDIQMPEMDGFSLLQNLEIKNFMVIFQTAYDEFALKAFEVNAYDYLLKPFTIDRLRIAISRVSQKQSLLSLESHLISEKKYLKSIMVKIRNDLRVLKVSEIECFYSQDHYTVVVSGGKEYLSNLSLSWLEGQLDVNLFLRCHRSNLINREQIQSIGNSQDPKVKLKNGMLLQLSRYKRQQVMKFLTLDK